MECPDFLGPQMRRTMAEWPFRSAPLPPQAPGGSEIPPFVLSPTPSDSLKDISAAIWAVPWRPIHPSAGPEAAGRASGSWLSSGGVAWAHG